MRANLSNPRVFDSISGTLEKVVHPTRIGSADYWPQIIVL